LKRYIQSELSSNNVKIHANRWLEELEKRGNSDISEIKK
jgi:hypothetical protein